MTYIPVAKTTATIFPESIWLTSHLYLHYVIFHINKGNSPPSLSFSPFSFCHHLPLSLSVPINLSHMELFGHSVLCSEESCYLIISLLSLQVPSESFSPHPHLSTQITGTALHLAFTWMLDIQTQDLTLILQVPYQISHLLQPRNLPSKVKEK